MSVIFFLKNQRTVRTFFFSFFFNLLDVMKPTDRIDRRLFPLRLLNGASVRYRDFI